MCPYTQFSGDILHIYIYTYYNVHGLKENEAAPDEVKKGWIEHEKEKYGATEIDRETTICRTKCAHTATNSLWLFLFPSVLRSLE